MSKLKEIPGVLFHKNCLAVIDGQKGLIWGTLRKTGHALNGKKAYLTFSEKGPKLHFKHHVLKESYHIFYRTRLIKKIAFSSPKLGDVILHEIFLNSYTPPKFTGSVHAIQRDGFSKRRKYRFKCILPLSKKLDFHNQVEQAIFESDLGISSRNATIATIDGIDIIACILENKKNDQRYLSIECQSKLDFETFNNKAHSVKNALGYLTGYLVGKHAYFFAFSDSENKEPTYFYYTEIRNEIISGYAPVNANPFSWVRDKNAAKKYHVKKTLREISFGEFSSLCQKLHDDLEFTSLVLLILESSVASLLFMPGGFAIALELMSDIVIGNQKEDLKPVPDKTVNESIRKDFFSVLEKYKSSISEDAFKIFSIKIDTLNQITNIARLTAPFKFLKIPLLQEDVAILKTRNDFLHGRVPDILKLGPNRSLDRVNKDLHYSSMRLYTLLNMVILKWIGYDNHVLNFPKIYEDHFKIKLKEQHYRKV